MSPESSQHRMQVRKSSRAAGADICGASEGRLAAVASDDAIGAPRHGEMRHCNGCGWEPFAVGAFVDSAEEPPFAAGVEMAAAAAGDCGEQLALEDVRHHGRMRRRWWRWRLHPCPARFARGLELGLVRDHGLVPPLLPSAP